MMHKQQVAQNSFRLAYLETGNFLEAHTIETYFFILFIFPSTQPGAG